MAYTRFAYGRVTVAFFDVVLVELTKVSGVSYTKPALMANSTFVALSTTSARLLYDVVKSINW